jgi:hypothetical protein
MSSIGIWKHPIVRAPRGIRNRFAIPTKTRADFRFSYPAAIFAIIDPPAPLSCRHKRTNRLPVKPPACWRQWPHDLVDPFRWRDLLARMGSYGLEGPKGPKGLTDKSGETTAGPLGLGFFATTIRDADGPVGVHAARVGTGAAQTLLTAVTRYLDRLRELVV